MVDIRNQASTKVRQITKGQLEELALTRKKGKQRRFFTKNRKYFRYPGFKCHFNHESPSPYSM